MSEVKLNLIDTQQVLHGTIHGSVADACVAALSAEPETIAELALALARYIKPLDEVSPFASFSSCEVSVPSEGVSQVEMSRGQEGGLAPALLSTGSDKALGSRPPSPAISAQREHVSTVNGPGSPDGQPGWRGGSGRVINLPPLDTEPWDAGIVVIDLAARIVSCESTYSMPGPSGEVHYHDGTSSTDIPVLYRLPDDWLFVNSVEAYQWSRERRAEERLTKTPLDVREVLYGAPLLNFIINECRNIDPSKIAAAAEHAAERAVGYETPEEAAADDIREYAVAEGASRDAFADDGAAEDASGDAAADDTSEFLAADHTRENAAAEAGRVDVAEGSTAERAVPNAAEDALATEISNIHARWLMTPREDLRGQSPREVLLARQDFIDFDLHTRSLQWTFLDEGPPCLGKNSFAYRFAGFGTHEFVIYYDLVRHLIYSLVEFRLNVIHGAESPTSNVQSPTSNLQSSFDPNSTIGNQHSPLECATQVGISQGQEGGLAPALLRVGTSPTQTATQVGISQGQEGGHAPALLSTISTAAQAAATQVGSSQGQAVGLAPAPIRTGSGSDRILDSTQQEPDSSNTFSEQDKYRTGSGSDRVARSPVSRDDVSDKVSTACGTAFDQLITTLDHIKTNWLEQPQPEYDGRIPAILIDNERKRLPEAMRPRDMIIDEDCPMCQMFGDETTPLGMGVGFWHLDGCNMDDDFAFSYYKTREEWEAENRRRDEFNAEFNRKWEERQQRIARGEPIEFDPFLDPDPFPGFELDEPSLISNESTDDEEELAQ